jgi:hypothetical protein
MYEIGFDPGHHRKVAPYQRRSESPLVPVQRLQDRGVLIGKL